MTVEVSTPGARIASAYTTMSVPVFPPGASAASAVGAMLRREYEPRPTWRYARATASSVS